MTAKLLGIFGINFIHISIPLFVRRRDNSATTCVTFFLNNSSISDYLFRIQTIIDSLSSLREHVSESDHVDIILDGLPDEFESLITIVS